MPSLSPPFICIVPDLPSACIPKFGVVAPAFVHGDLQRGVGGVPPEICLSGKQVCVCVCLSLTRTRVRAHTLTLTHTHSAQPSKCCCCYPNDGMRLPGQPDWTSARPGMCRRARGGFASAAAAAARGKVGRTEGADRPPRQPPTRLASRLPPPLPPLRSRSSHLRAEQPRPPQSNVRPGRRRPPLERCAGRRSRRSRRTCQVRGAGRRGGARGGGAGRRSDLLLAAVTKREGSVSGGAPHRRPPSLQKACCLPWRASRARKGCPATHRPTAQR